MKQLHLVVAVLIAFLSGLLIGATLFGLIGFALMGLIAGAVASTQTAGSERVYWVCLILLVSMILVSFIGLSVSRFLFIAPLIFSVSYFFARLVRRFSGGQAI